MICGMQTLASVVTIIVGIVGICDLLIKFAGKVSAWRRRRFSRPAARATADIDDDDRGSRGRRFAFL